MNTKRDLLVLFKQALLTPKAIEHEVELLHELLFKVESAENVAVAHELIDMNRYKIFSQTHILKKAFKNKNLKPFVFISNKN